MVDRTNREDGTTLTELLVVMAIVAIVGTVTTAGIVTGFKAQLSATNVSETLDGMRIATQRVREYVRGADEVCATSTETALTLWTDDNSDGDVQPIELDTFELKEIDGQMVFQRVTPTAGGGEVTQLIRDDIISDTVFEYDQPVKDQPSLQCHLEEPAGSGTTAVRVVDVLFTVEHPDPDQDPLETSTSVRLRNAELAEPSDNDAPKASFTVTCPLNDRWCHFDGTESSDAEDGASTVLFYSWELLDGETVIHTVSGYGFDGADTFSHQFPVGDREYDAVLTVTDSDGANGRTSRIARPVAETSNPPPTASFTFSCTGRTCDFDASSSDDDSGEPLTYAWDFEEDATGDPTSETPTQTFSGDRSYTVILTVTDNLGASASTSKTISVGSDVFYVSAMSGVKSGSGNSRTATVSVQLALLGAGAPGEGIVITVRLTDKSGDTKTGTCPTNSSGNCAVSFTGLSNAKFPMTGEVLSITSTGSYTYDPSHDEVEEVTVS